MVVMGFLISENANVNNLYIFFSLQVLLIMITNFILLQETQWITVFGCFLNTIHLPIMLILSSMSQVKKIETPNVNVPKEFKIQSETDEESYSLLTENELEDQLNPIPLSPENLLKNPKASEVFAQNSQTMEIHSNWIKSLNEILEPYDDSDFENDSIFINETTRQGGKIITKSVFSVTSKPELLILPGELNL